MVKVNVVFLGGISMAEVVLFHSVLGLRPRVKAAAERHALGHQDPDQLLLGWHPERSHNP